MSRFSLSELFLLAKEDYRTYKISGMETFLNSSTQFYTEYKKRGGKKTLPQFENKNKTN